MPSFIGSIIEVSNYVKNVYETIDSFIHPENYYKHDRDVIIINEARAIYDKAFPNRDIPPELTYKYENVTEVEANTRKPIGESYCPPYALPKHNKIGEFKLGRNRINAECRSAVMKIQAYLNKMNDNAESKFNRMCYAYGHHNDSVRFVFRLVMHTFVALTKLDLNDIGTLKEAVSFINFLTTMTRSNDIREQFNKISSIRINDIDEHPMAILNDALKTLEDVKKIVVYQISTCSIFDQTKLLFAAIESAVQDGFIFTSYILSANKISEYDTEIRFYRVNQANSQLTQRDCLIQGLSNEIHVLLPNQEIAENQHPLILDRRSTIEHQSELWSEVTKSPSPNLTGVYGPFLAKKHQGKYISAFLEYAKSLKKLSQLLKAVDHLQNVLKRVGDIIAVNYFSERIKALLRGLYVVLNELKTKEEIMKTFASEQNSELCYVKNKSKDQEDWVYNYSEMVSRLASNCPNDEASNAIAAIQGLLKDWSQNPKLKLQQFLRELKSLDEILLVLQDVTGGIGIPVEMNESNISAYDNRAIVEIEPGSAAASSPPAMKHLGAQSPKLTKVASQLSSPLLDYQLKKGYKFTYVGDNRGYTVPYDADNQSTEAKQHRAHAEWIFTCLQDIKSHQSDKDLIATLERRISDLYNSPAYKKYFNSILRKSEIEKCIEELKEKLNEFKRQLVTYEIPGNDDRDFELQDINNNPNFVLDSANGHEPSPHHRNLSQKLNDDDIDDTTNTAEKVYSLNDTPPPDEYLAESITFPEQVLCIVNTARQQLNSLAAENTDESKEKYEEFHLSFFETWLLLFRKMDGSLMEYHANLLPQVLSLSRETEYRRAIDSKLNSSSHGVKAVAQKVQQMLSVNTYEVPLEQRLQAATQHVNTFQQDKLGLPEYTLESYTPDAPPKFKPHFIYISPNSQKTGLMYRVLMDGKVQEEFISKTDMNEDLQEAFTNFAINNDISVMQPLCTHLVEIIHQTGNTRFPKCVWSENDYLHLLDKLQKTDFYEYNGKALSKKAAITFLKTVSHRLILTIQPQALIEEDNILIQDLENNLHQYEISPDKLFWYHIARGYLFLGVFPKNWVKSQIISKEKTTHDASLYLFVDLVSVLLSNIEYRSRFLGEVSAHMHEVMQELIINIKGFASNLSTVAETDDSSFWRSILAWMLRANAVPERSLLFLALVDWVDSLLNKVKLIHRSNDSKVIFEGMAPDSLLQTAKNKYIKHVGDGTWYNHDGHSYWISLEAAINKAIQSFQNYVDSRQQLWLSEELQNSEKNAQSLEDRLSNLSRKMVFSELEEVFESPEENLAETKVVELIKKKVNKITKIQEDLEPELIRREMEAFFNQNNYKLCSYKAYALAALEKLIPSKSTSSSNVTRHNAAFFEPSAAAASSNNNAALVTRTGR